MSYTLMIKKDGWESLLEIKIQEELLDQESDMLSLIKECFEKVFQFIKREKEDQVFEEDIDE